MITNAMSAVINAESQQVWRAITTPRDLVRWNEYLVASINVPDTYPSRGQEVRWRCRLGPIQLVLREQPLDIVPDERLHTRISLGSMRFEQTYSLRSEPGDAPRTRLGMKLVFANSIPVIGDVIDRFEVRRLAVTRIDATLRAVQKWCENQH